MKYVKKVVKPVFKSKPLQIKTVSFSLNNWEEKIVSSSVKESLKSNLDLVSISNSSIL